MAEEVLREKVFYEIFEITPNKTEGTNPATRTGKEREKKFYALCPQCFRISKETTRLVFKKIKGSVGILQTSCEILMIINKVGVTHRKNDTQF